MNCKLAILTAAVLVAPAAIAAGKPVKEVLVLHHSHLDVGYTHAQPMLWELQKDFLDEALRMLDDTADWPEHSKPRWTCEVTAPVMRWLETASPADVARFHKYAREGRIGISALQYNTTPLATAEGLARQLYYARDLRRRFDVSIPTANLHDATGLPWPVTDLLLDGGVEMLIMAINLHLSGTPKPRPAVYRWRSPAGRELLVMNGEHYTMFDQWLNPHRNSLEAMSEGLGKYLAHLERQGYPYDWIYLTATCAPYAYDNSPPNVDLPRLIRQWNEQGRQPRIRYVTPALLLEKIKQIPRASLPVVSGDWTDFWNFGAGSSAAETRLVRNATANLSAIELLETLVPADSRLRAATHRAWEDVHLYNEHTWGASNTLEHDNPSVTTQWQLKAQPAYESGPLTEYVLTRRLQQLAGNPQSFSRLEGVLLVNPGSAPVRYRVPVPDLWRIPGKRIESALMRLRDLRRYPGKLSYSAPVELPAFSYKILPLSQLAADEAPDAVRSGEDFIESPWHRLTFDARTGRVTGLLDKQRGWQVLDAASEWGFFQLVHEKPDPAVEPSRAAFHVRSVENERVGLTGWKTDWKAVRTSYAGGVTAAIEDSPFAATLVLRSAAEGLTRLEQRITLSGESPLIELTARFLKLDVRSPEALYFAFPLSLREDWRSHYDTAGIPVELDGEQIAGTCRDWVTADTYASVHQGERGVTLFCPDAPLVQVGGFHFGRNQSAIPRGKNPLLLAWPLNNYWETNFRASQPGFLETRYAFATHGRFDPLRAARDARQVMNPPLVHPVMDCPGPRQGRFVQVTGEGVEVLHVKAADDGQGVIVRLVNLASRPSDFELRLPERKVAVAWVAGTQEEAREPLAVQDSAVKGQLSPRQVTTIRVR